jgi:hypothetical protein
MQEKQVSVMVELLVPAAEDPASALGHAVALERSGFALDREYMPVPVSAPPEQAESEEAAGKQRVLVRGKIGAERVSELRAASEVASVWEDTRVEPFGGDPF